MEASSGLLKVEYGDEINAQVTDAREISDQHVGIRRDGARMGSKRWPRASATDAYSARRLTHRDRRGNGANWFVRVVT